MHLFDLPLELIEELFLEFVQTRSFKRAMRLRLVSRQFKLQTNEAIFRSRVLDRVASPFDLNPTASLSPWASFLQIYLAYRILLGIDEGCPGGNIRHVAERISELTGETREDQLRSCIASLCGLEFMRGGGAFNLLKLNPRARPTDEKFKSDVLDAAVYLDNIPLVKRLLSEEPSLGWGNTKRKGDPTVTRQRNPYLYHINLELEYRLKIATYNGNLEMIKLLLAADPTLGDVKGYLPRNLQSHLYLYAGRGTEGHREVFNFALDLTKPNHLQRSANTSMVHDRTIGMRETAFPDNFIGAATLLGLKGKDWWALEMSEYFELRLALSAGKGQVDMLRYCLEQGAAPNPSSEKKDAVVKKEDKRLSKGYRPLVLAAGNGQIETTKLLLESGADPNWYPPTSTALMAAVHRGHLSTVRTLVEHGADVNDGLPPPIALAVSNEDMAIFRYLRKHGAVLDTPETGAWAMGFAALHGLESMVECLCEEGVEREVVLSWVGEEEQKFTYFSRGGK